ncbi:MAG: protein TolQ [Pseudomonadota bacterium]|jgi:biopolymer transport protein TolQ|nr:protein TolQ [Syntrophaceae bacterium]MDI9555191.1 protein TolQ [Pseudomonadota bacterium]NLX32224.1 protein TolQ [Deltaproteobacteria bacterium]HNZ35935.1 protein TolQ [Syntrophales bacterium]HOF74831.1 protein TolQ [Syntrophales bacterium]
MGTLFAVSAVDFGGEFRGNLLQMVVDAGPMVQFVLLALLIFSIVSWAVILMKYRLVTKTEKENNLFLDAYMNSSKLSDVLPESKRYPNSTIAEVFRAGYLELGKISRAPKGASGDLLDASGIEMRGLDNVERALHRACGTETSKLESLLGFLATTGSACPFIGLFGTVWGIMNAFRGIGARGSATLAVVAPGISEALIATAFGLAAAIPAVIFYNYYLNRIRSISLEMDNFASEFLNIVERHYLQR